MAMLQDFRLWIGLRRRIKLVLLGSSWFLSTAMPGNLFHLGLTLTEEPSADSTPVLVRNTSSLLRLPPIRSLSDDP